MKNETVLITPEEKAKINKGLESAVATWRKRKRMCMNALGEFYIKRTFTRIFIFISVPAIKS